MGMSTPPPPVPVVRKSLRPWYYLGGFVLLTIAAVWGFSAVTSWLRDRELAALYAEMDADDPHWRWPDLIANLPAPPPDDRNSAVQILKVRGPVARSTFAPVIFPKDVIHPPNIRLPDKHAKALRAVFDKLDPALLEETRKLKDLPAGRFKIEPTENPHDPAYDYPIHLGILNVMRLLQHDAIRRADERDTEGAAESCQALLNIIQTINDAPGLMAYLIRAAGQSKAIGAIERTLGHGEVSEPRLKQLQAALAHEAEFNGLYHNLRGERAMIHQLYAMVREGKVPLSKLNQGMNANRGKFGWIYDLFPSSVLGDHAENLRGLNELVEASKRKDEAQAAAFAVLEKKMLNNPSPFAASAGPILGMVSSEHPIAQARLRCAVAAIAAERYRIANNRWPSSADELVKSGLLKEIYNDPFDGQPLRWKRTATGIIIYSVGPDRTDNGGKLNRSGGQAPGTDIGFELWLPSFRALSIGMAHD